MVASSTDAAWLGLGYIGGVGVQVATAPADAQSSPTIRVGVPSRPDTVGHTQPAPRQRPGAAARPSPMHLRYPWLTFTEVAADYEPMCGLHTNSTSHAHWRIWVQQWQLSLGFRAGLGSIMYIYGLWASQLSGILKGWQNFPEELTLG